MTGSLHVLFSDEGHPVAIRKWSKEPFDDAVEYVRKSDIADLIAACDALLDWADANARWFDISTAPKDKSYILVLSEAGFMSVAWFDKEYDDFPTGLDNRFIYATHWRPLPPPPSNPPLPEPLEALGAVLRRVKGENG